MMGGWLLTLGERSPVKHRTDIRCFQTWPPENVPKIGSGHLTGFSIHIWRTQKENTSGTLRRWGGAWIERPLARCESSRVFSCLILTWAHSKLRGNIGGHLHFNGPSGEVLENVRISVRACKQLNRDKEPSMLTSTPLGNLEFVINLTCTSLGHGEEQENKQTPHREAPAPPFNEMLR